MRVKVELHPDVVWFVRHRCNRDEVDVFYERLEAVRKAPIGRSEPLIDPRVRKYVLRLFRFGTNIAVFAHDAGRNRIRVLECRKSPPARRARSDPDDVGPP